MASVWSVLFDLIGAMCRRRSLTAAFVALWGGVFYLWQALSGGNEDVLNWEDPQVQMPAEFRYTLF